MSAYPANLLEALRAEPGVKLSERATKDADWWPGDAPQDKKAAEKRMVQLAELLSDLQERL
ncbi:MAG: polyphosphate kinase 2 family protein, partial [Glutamicibacter sp.]